MRKISYIFTAILAIVASTGAWASTPTEKEAQNGTSHPVYDNAPIEGEATEGIAGVTYVNRVANRAGAAAQAAEDHAAHASKSAYDAATAASNAATAASNAQASADIAAAVINNLQAGDGVTVADVKSADGQSTVGKKVSAKISGGLKIPDSGDDKGAIVVNPGVGIEINNGAVAVNMGAGLKTDPNGAVTINEGVGLKLEGNVLVPNLIGGDSVTITPGTGDDKDKLVISVQPSDTFFDEVTNQVLGNVNAGTAITVTPTMVGEEVTDIAISANTPTATTPGVVYVPSWADLQNGKLPADATDYSAAMGLQTYIDSLAEMVPSGAMSGSYQNYTQAATDGSAALQGDTEARARWISKPLSAAASYDLALLYRGETVSLKKDGNGNPIDDVGNDARPVYVVDGAAAAVKSVAIPVDADNFEKATTTAKIWIQ